MDIVTLPTVEVVFVVIGWNRCTRIDETLWIEGADRARAGLAIAAGIRPQHDLKTVASVDRKRQSSGEIVFILVSPHRDDVAVNAFALVSEQRDAAPDAFTERPRNRHAGRTLLIITDSESKRPAPFVGRHFG